MEAQDYVLDLKKANFTQVQISDRTEISQSTISKIERGDVADVMSKNYRALQAMWEQECGTSKAA